MRRSLRLGLAFLMAGGLAGCRVISTTGCCLLGVVGVAGYAVYKTGELAVTGVGQAAQATGRALSPGSRSVETVSYDGNELRVDYAGDVNLVWEAAVLACRKAGLQSIAGSQAKGFVTARNPDGTEVRVTLASLGVGHTAARIQPGSGGMESAESLHRLIRNEINPLEAL